MRPSTQSSCYGSRRSKTRARSSSATGTACAFRSVGAGRLVKCPDRNLRHGTVVREVEGGNGQFERAEGLITSNFLVSDTGEVTDNHLGLIFVHEQRSETSSAVRKE